ncbi:hypothetical protein LTR97_009383 [Elasticomyces elasticus]|uniref:Exonuclease domain-containing protein n=1 Tax=Elasticomyces elasticus TaxID=574655 RepID=A0AAN7VNC9_9PEZI|nr:hypothetical protein LTR97_009383 [Elasticomyces elasticus]
MPVTTATADQVRREGRNATISTNFQQRNGTSKYSGSYGQQRSNDRQRARMIKRSSATQLWPRFDLVTDVLAFDIEGCERYGVHYVGSLSGVNEKKECALDVFADHGGHGTDEVWIKSVPPLYLNLGVKHRDLAPYNGARPIEEIVDDFINLATGRTVIFHDFRADKELLDNSAAKAGVTIPWDSITVRDTQKFAGYWLPDTRMPGPALKNLADKFLPLMKLQQNGHNSREDAIATILLYLRERTAIEKQYRDAATAAAATTTTIASQVSALSITESSETELKEFDIAENKITQSVQEAGDEIAGEQALADQPKSASMSTGTKKARERSEHDSVEVVGPGCIYEEVMRMMPRHATRRCDNGVLRVRLGG